ncbi:MULTISPECIES: hypothetical protein [Arthrobacter]|uniref:hypothetical protein n=1 Tax=Arthrobacter TaxID=1663 RepID=UPI0028F6F565|nr:hypothetical protein [Arthrobacter sp. lap29]
MNIPSTPRTDLPYLRRRVKPGTAKPAPAQAPIRAAAAPAPASTPSPSLSLRSPAAAAPAPVSAPSPSLTLRQPATAPAPTPATPTAAQGGAPRPSGLVLGGAAPDSSTSPRAKKLAAQREKAKREDHEVALLFEAPGIRDIFELNLADRVLRLSALESSVGTLLVGGSTAVAWEDARHVTGGQSVDGHKAGTAVMTSGNRELVGYHGRDALVSLRHVRELRRAIFINRSSSAMGVRLYSGESVALPPAADGTQMVLLLHRIGNVLELRAEPIPHDWSDLQIWQEFDFSMTHRAPTTAYGR